jgi:hypothetical protein
MATPTLKTLLNNADIANNLTNKFIVSPVFNLGIAGFVFDIPKETRIRLESESTDHYAEDNSALQDHIALKPIIIETGGFVSELKYTVADPKDEIQELVERLTTINAFIPPLTEAARSTRDAINTAQTETNSLDTLGATTNSAIDIYKAYKDINPPDTEQARIFNFFKALRDARQLVAIDSPWGFYNNLEIRSLNAVQSQDTKSVTDFSLTLKEFRTVRTQFVTQEFQNFTGRGQAQRSAQQNQGKAQGERTGLSSILSRSFSGLLN